MSFSRPPPPPPLLFAAIRSLPLRHADVVDFRQFASLLYVAFVARHAASDKVMMIADAVTPPPAMFTVDVTAIAASFLLMLTTMPDARLLPHCATGLRATYAPACALLTLLTRMFTD